MHRERKHIRLHNFDYRSEHRHFITICTNRRECFFGKLTDKEMILSPIGGIANLFWTEIPKHFPHVVLDKFIIMPNHIHGIIKLVYSNFGKSHEEITVNNIKIGACHGMALSGNSQKKINEFGNPVPGSVSVVINHYKSAVKRWCNNNRHEEFSWQPRFYDHIINNRKDLAKIRNYIIFNPVRIEDPDK